MKFFFAPRKTDAAGFSLSDAGMKKRKCAAVLSVAVTLLWGAWIPLWGENVETSNRLSNDRLPKQSRPGLTESSPPWMGNSRVQLPPHRGEFDPNLPQWKEWNRRRAEDAQWESKLPISFFGRVFDLQGIPIEGARIAMRWSNVKPPDGSEEAIRLTDSKGNFELTGAEGRLLTVKLEKEGYHELRKSNQLNFEYAQFYDSNYYIPAKNDPILFKLQKRLKAEALYSINLVQNEIPPDHGKVALNFAAGRAFLGDEGDLRILIQRPPTKGEAFDYVVEIRGNNGWKMAATTEEFPTLAPESGYEDGVRIEAKANDRNWRQRVERKFYIRRGEGDLFGILMLDIDTNNNRITRKETTQRCGVRAELRINPTGSRILEYDPQLRVPKL
jgi:hypothetical protein